jgi:hypothetical protein
MSLHVALAIFCLIMFFLQVELGFGNGVIDDIFFVPGYSISGSVVAQVIFVEGLSYSKFDFLSGITILSHFFVDYCLVYNLVKRSTCICETVTCSRTKNKFLFALIASLNILLYGCQRIFWFSVT